MQHLPTIVLCLAMLKLPISIHSRYFSNRYPLSLFCVFKMIFVLTNSYHLHAKLVFVKNIEMEFSLCAELKNINFCRTKEVYTCVLCACVDIGMGSTILMMMIIEKNTHTHTYSQKYPELQNICTKNLQFLCMNCCCTVRIYSL